ncbi:MAG: hypothetical protein RPG89_08900 [Microcystis panniformis WG22]|nr:hypothetical protein [Microcystis panniformis WG22]
MKIYECYKLLNRYLSSGDNQKLALILEEITILILPYFFENFSQLLIVKAALKYANHS